MEEVNTTELRNFLLKHMKMYVTIVEKRKSNIKNWSLSQAKMYICI